MKKRLDYLSTLLTLLYAHRFMRAYHLGFTELLTLLILANDLDAHTVKSLSNQLGITRHASSTVLNRLCDCDLVYNFTDPDDKRQKFFLLASNNGDSIINYFLHPYPSK